MKPILFCLFFVFSSTVFSQSVHDFEIKDIKGKPLKLSRYKGSPLLIVNIATQCGYTGQLGDLEKLYQTYKSKGFEILGIPSNDFGGQTPEEDLEVAKFCKLNYGVSFTLSKKSVVKGTSAHPLIKFLIKKDDGTEISWNFEKFLIDANGKLIKRFKSSVSPLDNKIIKFLTHGEKIL